jgi:hypothetical protein
LSAASKSATVGEKDDEGASTMSALQSKMDRLDSLLERRLANQEDEQRRADASLEEARRQRQRANAEARREIQATYADAFQSFGTEVPAPVDDEAVPRYRARLFNRLVRRLPEGHEWQSVRADEIPLGPAMDTIERLVIEACKLEGANPSYDNLPSDGSLVARHRVDADTGSKVTEFFGRRSFLADMGRPGRRVAKIMDRRTGQAIWQAR